MKELHKINNLEQVRLLADPLKLRLLQAFAEQARTTKQVATELGESVTKLYRHVDALHDAGLLEVVDERQKRGAIERTFRAVAHRFEADHTLFKNQADSAGVEAAREILRVTESEILNVLTKIADDEDDSTMIVRVRGRASADKIAELQAALESWLDSINDCDDPSDGEASDFGGLIAFYRMD